MVVGECTNRWIEFDINRMGGFAFVVLRIVGFADSGNSTTG